ncbi:M56 family metallopeptidase [Colwellia sp. Bg11-28]|uniref:M56 family metallopeptidase n=1 Tax=Colwellia sp. Bg11-28 TaxID=2058305 RepID=UPI000C341699|nr:M56 family metallopeptidase [Colwellia sp. Bg11-28]PKH85549.1 peptidase M56 [Colwellia sp. Bg11-28]
MFEQLFNSPFLYSLSLTLVHFLWQGLLVALILKSLLYIIDKNKSKLRYTLATFAMLSNAILAVLTFTMVYPDTSSGINSYLSPIPLTSLVNELTQQNALFTYQELLPSILAYSLPYLSLLWLATIAILSSKLLIEIRNVNNLPLHSSISPSLALSARFEELAKQIKLAKTPRLLISLKAEVPMAIGWLKPVVLLPASMVTGLNAAQLEMLILHELAHIRRHDYLVNFLQALIELLFFFHPSVHWIGKQMRNEREYCSDDIAVQHCGDAIAYAHTLTDTASLCAKNHFHTIPTMAMAASGGDLKERVLRLVDHHCAPTNNTSKWLAAVSLLLALALLSMNQLLTMPFAQQLNNKFPWQEKNSINSNIASTTIAAINFNKDNTSNRNTTLNNDSIAQQLLHREETLPHASVVELENNQNAFALKSKNESELTTAIVEPLAISNYQDTIKAKETAQINRSATISSTKQITAGDNEVLTALRVKVQRDSRTTPQLTSAKSDLNVAKNSLSSTTNLQPLAIEKSQPQLILSSISADKFTAQPAIINSSQEGNMQLSLLNDKALNSKKDSYHKLAYNQEVNKLAEQSEFYKASNTVKVGKASEIEPSKQEVLQMPTSFEAKLLNSINPVYPSLAKRRGLEMEVQVDFIIDRDGKVKDISFAQQSKLIYFKSAIRSAIRKWRFSPATINNRKVESKMTKIFSFSLHA